MPPIPVLDARNWPADTSPDPEFARSLLEACRANGCFYLEGHGLPDTLCAEVLEQAGRFFDLPTEAKSRIHLRHSPHFRGYSVMKNDRDWREQLHFGQEPSEPAGPLEQPDYEQLSGPNQWPEELGESFRTIMLDFLAATGRLGRQLLAVLAKEIGLPDQYFDLLSAPMPYDLLKLICYYPQPRDEEKPGVAPHCDWSWITILLQDEQGGLEVQTSDSDWLPVPPRPGALFVNLGELTEMLTGGEFRATAHRVFNPSEQHRRLSAPVFINPALEALIEPIPLSRPLPTSGGREKSHVHRVVARGTDWPAFRFGDSEWRRKGLGYWCYDPACLGR